MNVGSVCSGAGFMDLGFHRAGHRTVWFCEADAYRRRVLARHFPGVPIYPDLTELDPAELEPVDCFIGGTPCPDWSNAGKQAGFGGERAGLFWHFARVRDGLRPRWTVWENVPGVFSTHGGRDFALILGAFVGAVVPVPAGGWVRAGVAVGPVGSAAWRLLNAQWFGVPQRRRRVFVVADFGGVRAEQVLFEREGGGGDPAASGEARPQAARSFGAGVAGALGVTHRDPTDLERGGGIRQTVGCLDGAGGGVDDNDARAGHLVVAATLSGGGHPGSNAPGRRREDDANLVALESDTHTHTHTPGRCLTSRGGRLDGESDTFVLPRDSDPDQRSGRGSVAGRQRSDRSADR